MRVTAPSRRTRRRSSRGQSLAELAIVLPVILLIVMVALDFGRAFFSWVTITNASRVAASYAADNPDKPFGSGSEYQTRFNQELSTNQICPLAAGFNPPTPTFIDGPDAGTNTKDFGDSARVAVQCNFRILTPVIGSVIGNNLQMSAASTFPIRSGIQ